MKINLTRYWFTFENLSPNSPLLLGCGLTAYNYDDALNIINKNILCIEKQITISNFDANIKISDLDAGKVLPNIGDVSIRGIWFPIGCFNSGIISKDVRELR
jgi:hypothetical protein